MADQGAEGLFSPYLRRKRVAVAMPYIKGRVLDVGCGSGLFASEIPPENYLGIDIDADSIGAARKRFPNHTFLQAETYGGEKFDTILALAVIEHVPNYTDFLGYLKSCLRDDRNARIVGTTPHPWGEPIHWLGSRIGAFSKSANEEHNELLDREKLASGGNKVGLKMIEYKRFLFGANQLFVFGRR